MDHEGNTIPMEDQLELKHADSSNSIPPPPPPPIPPVATAESDELPDTEESLTLKSDLRTPQEEVNEKMEICEVRSDNCCERLLRCLSYVPCGSLIAWIILLLALGGLAGSLIVGSQKTRTLLHDERLLWFMEYSVIGVVVSMFVIGTSFLVAGYLSTDPTSRRIFNSSSKNMCARGLNIFLLVFVYILCLSWVLLSVLLSTPVVLLVLMYIVTGQAEPDSCLDLANYGFSERGMVCKAELDRFKEHAQDVLICFSVSLLSSVLVAISLIHFLICISANITHLKDNRFTTLNAYETEELRNSKHSVLDTNM